MAIKTVLLADDEDDIRAIVKMALSATAGWEVTCFPSGREALEHLKANGSDVVLLDVMMPPPDGPETLAQIRADATIRDTPVVFLTAKVQRREVAGYLELGAIGVISKPFDPMNLAEQIRTLVEGQRVEAEKGQGPDQD